MATTVCAEKDLPLVVIGNALWFLCQGSVCPFFGAVISREGQTDVAEENVTLFLLLTLRSTLHPLLTDD